MGNEDKKQAVSIVTTLSGQLMAAALAIIALEGAFLTFAMDKKVCGVLFWGAAIAAFLSLVISIIGGGKGIAKLYKAGANADWDYAKGDTHFQLQTLFCLIGLLFFMGAVVVARKDKTPDTHGIKNEISKVVSRLDKQVLAIEHVSVQWHSNETSLVFARITELHTQVEELRREIERIKAASSVTITNLVQIAGITNIIQVGPTTNFVQMPWMTNIIIAPQSSTKPTSVRRWIIGIGRERQE